MVRIIISGCCGHMGRVVEEICLADSEVEIVAGFDRFPAEKSYPVYTDLTAFKGQADAVIDFSNPAALEPLLAYCTTNNVAAVLATTGYSAEQLAMIDQAAAKIPVFRSANMSLGINVMAELVRRAAQALGSSCDIEIVERHHNRKVDAPSGTALMLADAASAGLGYQPDYVYDRSGRRQPRPKQEIGIYAVRGGTIVGLHDVIFAGRDEIIEITHTAQSREIFASGAVSAAKFLSAATEPGMYNMQQLVASVL